MPSSPLSSVKLRHLYLALVLLVVARSDAAQIAAAANGVGAFAFAPNSKDSALLLNLAPGPYTAQLSGAGATTGAALVEVYDVP